MYSGMFMSVTDTAGAVIANNYGFYLPLFHCNASFGGQYNMNYLNSYGNYYTQKTLGSDYGIMVGTGTAAVITTDDNLQTLIQHGTSSGKLQYLGCMIPGDVTISAPNASFNIERLFLNSSGGDVTINEIGIYAAYFTSIYCIIRDLVSPAVTVANNEYLKVTYTIQVSV
jgi:hypothetical protein